MCMCIFQISESMESVINKLKDDRISHPVVIVLSCRQAVGQVFLVVEREALPITFSIVSAIEWLMKIYFILHMEFAAECKHILHFCSRLYLGCRMPCRLPEVQLTFPFLLGISVVVINHPNPSQFFIMYLQLFYFWFGVAYCSCNSVDGKLVFRIRFNGREL